MILSRSLEYEKLGLFLKYNLSVMQIQLNDSLTFCILIICNNYYTYSIEKYCEV